MIALYPTPDLFDAEGWKQHLDWLRTEPEKIVARADAIEHAEMMVSILETTPLAKRPADAA